MSGIWEELKWRGLVAQVTDEEALKELLAGEQISFYCGFDPTAASLHHGHLVQLILMKHLQQAGHRPIALVGGATGLIGDPRMSGERVLNSADVVAQWSQALRNQIEPFLSFTGPNAAIMENNYNWISQLSAIDLLRDVGKHFRLGTMLAKDTVARRLESEQGISFTEFSYQLLQAYDFLKLFEQENCILQTGGNDQWGNLLGGVELIRKVHAKPVQVLTTPLITKADGTKFGKTEGGAVWLAPELMSPYAFYQYWINADDADVVNWLKIFTFLDRSQIEELAIQVTEKPFLRTAQKTLAFEVTQLVHGQKATSDVVQASEVLFGNGDFASVDLETLLAAGQSLPNVAFDADVPLLDVLISVGLVKSKNEAKRALADGGIYLNNVKVSDPDIVLTSDLLIAGKCAVLRRGKKKLSFIVAK